MTMMAQMDDDIYPIVWFNEPPKSSCSHTPTLHYNMLAIAGVRHRLTELVVVKKVLRSYSRQDAGAMHPRVADAMTTGNLFDDHGDPSHGKDVLQQHRFSQDDPVKFHDGLEERFQLVHCL